MKRIYGETFGGVDGYMGDEDGRNHKNGIEKGKKQMTKREQISGGPKPPE